MIDTDKYEGHTLKDLEVDADLPEWAVFDEEGNVVADYNPIENGVDINEANARLIADAPLLLAEVKRLREELRITQSNFSMVRNALANQYPEIEEAIWKVIE
mgnify:CR=1 FL=1